MKRPKTKTPRSLFALASLLIANLLTVYVFFAHHGSITQVLWIYLSQAAVIGVVCVLSILLPPVGVDRKTTALAVKDLRLVAASLFGLFYGLILGGVALMLPFVTRSDGSIYINGILKHYKAFDFGTVDAKLVLLLAALYAAHHIAALITERANAGQNGAKNADGIWDLIHGSMPRIQLLYVTVLLGPLAAAYFDSLFVFVAFMVLKTVVDMGLYVAMTKRA